MKARVLTGIALSAIFLAAGLSAQAPASFYRGADLSYVNEMEDHGGVYREKGQAVDPFALFARHGANLVRVRLWIDASWTAYSDLADARKTLARAKAAGMDTLLDLHYSNEWADPGKQFIPTRWKALDDGQLAVAVHDYTVETLNALAKDGLLPRLVQVGNETNQGLLKRVMKADWQRDAPLFNAGIRAVREVAAQQKSPIGVIIHVAQPQNALALFGAMRQAGITDFDIMGLSYYPQWSMLDLKATGETIRDLQQTFGKPVLIVETGLPWTLDRFDSASNLLTQAAPGYKITPEAQRDFLVDLSRTVKQAGGLGVVYWEPAWISSSAKTRWGQGSHWENASFFDFWNDNEMLPAIDFFGVKLD